MLLRENYQAESVYVENGLRTNLLGLPAILTLKLVAKLEETVVASLHTSGKVSYSIPRAGKHG